MVHASNSWNEGYTVSEADFVTLDSSCMDDPRGPDGALPMCDFLRLAPTSPLIDAGTDVGLSYEGEAPDLGARETE